MNKKQKREQVRASRLGQKVLRELNRAVDLMQTYNNTEATPEVLASAVKGVSARVLGYLANETLEIPEGLFISNGLCQAAQNELIERNVLRAK